MQHSSHWHNPVDFKRFLCAACALSASIVVDIRRPPTFCVPANETVIINAGCEARSANRVTGPFSNPTLFQRCHKRKWLADSVMQPYRGHDVAEEPAMQTTEGIIWG